MTRTLALISASALALQIGLVSPSGAVSLNNNVAGSTADAANVFDQANQYSNVVWVNNCTGTLLNSRTIVTAAHCFYQNDQFAPGGSVEVRFGADAAAGSPRTAYDQTAAGLAVVPGYTFNGTNGDLAIVTLSTPVTRASIKPVVMVGPNDPMPAPGSLMITVGYGQYGTGLDAGLYSKPEDEGGAPYNARRRVGETRLGGYIMWDYDGRTPGPHGILAAQFRNPQAPGLYDDYQLTAKGFDVPAQQAGNGAGDSGGPLFQVLEDGSLRQIGVLALLVPAADGTIRYGSISGWTALQDYLAWIYASNPLREVSARSGHVAWSDATAWSEGEVPDNQAGSLLGPYGMAGRYFNVNLFEPGHVSLDMNATIDGLAVDGRQTLLDINPNRTLEILTGATMTAGEIFLNGTIATPFLHMDGGMLSGTGVLRIADFGVKDLSLGVFNMAGTVAPGSATQTGVLTIDGNYIQGQHGTLSIRIGDGSSDRLAVTGQAFLAGTMAISAKGLVALDTPYSILTTNGISGAFGGILSDFAFLDPTLIYSNTDVSALLRRNAVAFSGVAQTANQVAAAAAFERLDPSRLLYRNVLGLNAAEARNAFDMGSGEIHASLKSVLIDDSWHLREAANRRLREADAMPSTTGQAARPAAPSRIDQLAFWAHGYGSWGDITGDGNAARVARASGGFLIGGDAPIADTGRLGMVGGYSQTTFSVAQRMSSGASDNYHVGLYGGGDLGSLVLRSGAFYTEHNIRSNRSIAFAGFNDQAHAAYHAHTLQAFGEAAYRWKTATANLEPYINLAHVRLTTDGFSERAEQAALSAASQSSGVTFTTAGMRASTDFNMFAQRMSLNAGIGWRHAFGDRLPLATLGLSAESFTVAGTAIAQNAAVLDASLGLLATDVAALSVTYRGQLASSASEHGISARLKIRF